MELDALNLGSGVHVGNSALPLALATDAGETGEATVIIFNKPLALGTIKLAAGSYTITTIPGPSEWQLLIGRLSKPGQWGVPYDKSLEIGRTPMKLRKMKSSVEQVTYFVDSTPTGATLRIEWGTRSATVPITVPN